MKKLPVLCKLIAGWNDHQIVPALLKHKPIPTEEFFYGKCYPMFKSLHTRYYTDCVDVLEFINEMYLDIMRPRAIGKRCKLELFNFQCALHNWVGVISLRYCYAAFKKRKNEIFTDTGDRNEEESPSLFVEMHIMEREDVEKILAMMANERYREIIRLRYLDGNTNEETAAKLSMEMSNYYNKHLLAKAQYIAAYKKEMGL